MSITAFVDRIEGEWAILIDKGSGEEVSVPTTWLPGGGREGQALSLTFAEDPDAEAALRAEVSERLSRLKAAGGGPIDSGELEL